MEVRADWAITLVFCGEYGLGMQERLFGLECIGLCIEHWWCVRGLGTFLSRIVAENWGDCVYWVWGGDW